MKISKYMYRFYFSHLIFFIFSFGCSKVHFVVCRFRLVFSLYFPRPDTIRYDVCRRLLLTNRLLLKLFLNHKNLLFFFTLWKKVPAVKQEERPINLNRSRHANVIFLPY